LTCIEKSLSQLSRDPTRPLLTNILNFGKKPKLQFSGTEHNYKRFFFFFFWTSLDYKRDPELSPHNETVCKMCKKKSFMILVLFASLLLVQSRTFPANDATSYAACNPQTKFCSGGHIDAHSNATVPAPVPPPASAPDPAPAPNPAPEKKKSKWTSLNLVFPEWILRKLEKS
jgi:hypothetical protein